MYDCFFFQGNKFQMFFSEKNVVSFHFVKKPQMCHYDAISETADKKKQQCKTYSCLYNLMSLFV